MTTTAVATTLAMLVSALSPLVLRYVHLDGLSMSAVSYALAVLVALAASLLTGDLHLDQASLLTVLGGSTAFWTVQQAVYAILKQVSPQTVGAVAKPSSTPTPGAKPA